MREARASVSGLSRQACGQRLVDVRIESDELDAIEFALTSTRLAHGDRRGLVERIAVHAAADRGKRDRARLVLPRQRSAVR